MSKIILIDEKMNSIIIEVTPAMLKAWGVNPEEIKKHKSRRQLNLTLSEYLEKYSK